MYDDFEDNPRTHFFILVDPDTGDVLVDDAQVPTDIEKYINNISVWVETKEDGTFAIHKKTINIRELLLHFGPSAEMKQRLKNGQIKINNQVIKSFDVEADFDISSQLEDEYLPKYEELPEFIIENVPNLKQLLNRKRYMGLDIMNFFGSPTLKEGPTNIKQYEFLEGYVLLSISKKEHFVFKNNQISKQPYSITKCKQ